MVDRPTAAWKNAGMTSIPLSQPARLSVSGTGCDSNRVLVIAELGTGHGGSTEKARELVEAAAESGADVVKFQMVYAEEILHPATGLVPLPGGAIPLFERFRHLELPLEFFAEMKRHTEALGLAFLCTPFGPRSARDLESLACSFYKIASPELNYDQLLTLIAGFGSPLLLSSGVSTLSDIDHALDIARRSLSAEDICLLHCVTSYPAPEEDYNLRVLHSLRSVFGVSVGVSDHSLDPELVPQLAVACGAIAIEKHFCLSRKDDGLDDPIALPPKDFKHMVQAIRRASSEGCDETLRRVRLERGQERVEQVLGDGIKRVANAERENYARTRRSIHALRDLKKGHILKAEDVACLRSEKVLRPGLEPQFLSFVTGRALVQDVPSGEGIRFEDL